jgi:hypothetical protein
MVDQHDWSLFTGAAGAGYFHQGTGIQLGWRRVGGIADIYARGIILDEMGEELLVKKSHDPAQFDGDMLAGFLNA